MSKELESDTQTRQQAPEEARILTENFGRWTVARFWAARLGRRALGAHINIDEM
jgi:hypothetical protein